MATYYQPSGKSSGAGILILLVGGLVAAVVLGAIYAYATHFIPFIYISFLLTMGYAFAMGWVVNQLTKMGKIRNPSLVMWASIIIGIVAVYSAWVFWFHAALGVLFVNPMDVLGAQQVLGLTGAWSIGSFAPTGTTLYAFWGVEAAIIAIGTWLSSQNQVLEPFCEPCEKWLETKKEVTNLSLSEAPTELLKSLEAGSVDDLLKLKKTEDSAYTKISLKDCPSCKVTTLMDLGIAEIVVDNEGKASEKVSMLMENFVLTPQNFAKIESHIWENASVA